MAALFISLGGTGYAASQLDHSSVATVAKKKKKPATQADSAADKKLFNSLLAAQLPAAHVAFAATAGSANTANSANTATNATHAVSADSATNATNATHATTSGNASELGGVAPSGYQTRIRWALVKGDGTEIIAQSGGISIASHFTGGYYLDWGSSIAGRALISSLANSDIFSVTIASSICGGGKEGVECTVAGTNDNHHSFTYTTDEPAKEADRTFYIESIG